MMDEKDLNDELAFYGRRSTPDPSRELMDRLLSVPHQVEQAPVSLFRAVREMDFWRYLMPRLAGLAFACAAGIYLGQPVETGGDGATYDLAVNDYLVLSDEILEQEDNS